MALPPERVDRFEHSEENILSDVFGIVGVAGFEVDVAEYFVVELFVEPGKRGGDAILGTPHQGFDRVGSGRIGDGRGSPRGSGQDA